MNLVVRRRLAAGALLATSALVAGVLMAPSSNAAAGALIITPSTVENSNSAADMTFDGADTDFEYGSTVTFTRVGGGTPFSTTTSGDTPPLGEDNEGTKTVNFTDMGDGIGNDGPADAGTYNVSSVGMTSANPIFPGGGTDNCSSCFTVLAAGPVSVSGITPTSLRPGRQGNVKIGGNNFERGARVDFLFENGTVDPLITTALPTSDDTNGGSTVSAGITTRTQIWRRATVSSSDAPGKRGVRVTHLDGSTSSCTACFFVAGAALTGMTPNGGSNDPTAAPVSVTFSGPNVVDGEPRLEFTGNPGGTSRDLLTIIGTKTAASNGTSMTASFDLHNAAPGPYQGVIRDQSSGIVNACEAPCPAFTVVQPSNRKPPTVTGLDRDPNTAGNQKDQPAGSTRTFNVAGTNLSKGVAITTTATKVTVTAVEFVSDTLVKATISAASDATAGDYNVTATLSDGTASAACTGCYTVGAASPSPTPTSTSTKSPTPSQTPCPTPSATPSDTPTATTTPTASPTPSDTATATTTPSGSSCAPLTISVSPKDIVPTQASLVRVHGAAHQAVQVYAYSRPSTTYGLVRSGTTDASGNASWTVTPGGNTRLYAHYTNGTTKTASNDSPTTVITVHTSLSLSAYRDGLRKYHFQGTNLPRRAGQLITLYRYATGAHLDQYCVPTAESDTFAKSDGSCHAIITSQAKTGANNTWRIDRVFKGSGKFYFVVRTSENINNGRGHSNQRLTIIH